MASAGWYEDPTNPALLRYWDGQVWGMTKPRSKAVSAGSKLQSAGDGIAKTGMAVIWIVIALFALGVIFLLF